MIHICAFCEREITKDGDIVSEIKMQDEDDISHGVCRNCYLHIKASMGVDINEYLYTLSYPVVLLNSELAVNLMNSAGRKITEKTEKEAYMHKLGEVFECENSYKEGGCGGSICCSGCTIRRSIIKTFRTGEELDNVPAVLHKKEDCGSTNVNMLVSTRKQGGVVLLIIKTV